MLPHERAAVLGVPVALVGQLATQSDHRAARDRFALAPSRLLGNLDVRLMWALAWRTPKDQQRDACADRADEPREFLMGCATDPWRAAEAWMFNQIIAGKSLPRYLSSDHDPLFRFHRWLANLRILEVEEIKSAPYVPVS